MNRSPAISILLYLMVLTAVLVLLAHPNQRSAYAVTLDAISTPVSQGRTIDTVGAKTVDRIYRMTVPANTLLIVSLQGESGAELGLYLFDSLAASVAEDTPIVQSAKPGANQEVRTYFLKESTIFINVNGRNTNREYSYALDLLVISDTTAPQIISLKTPQVARAEDVCVKLEFMDRQSGIAAVELELGNADHVQNFKQSTGGLVCGSFPAGDGVYPITVRVINRVGLSTSRTSTVRIDNSPPQQVIRDAQTSVLNPTDATIVWRFNEPVRLRFPSSEAARVFFSTGEAVAGTVRLSPSGERIKWIASKRVARGSVLVASVAGLEDVAGNKLNSTSAEVFSVLGRSRISTRSISCGNSECKVQVTISKSLIGRTLGVYGLTSRGWTIVKEFRSSTRTEVIKFSSSEMESYAVLFNGDDEVRPAQSPTFSRE